MNRTKNASTLVLIIALSAICLLLIGAIAGALLRPKTPAEKLADAIGQAVAAEPQPQPPTAKRPSLAISGVSWQGSYTGIYSLRFTAKNLSKQAIADVDLLVEFRQPGRSVAAWSKSIRYAIHDGLEPGESKAIQVNYQDDPDAAAGVVKNLAAYKGFVSISKANGVMSDPVEIERYDMPQVEANQGLTLEQLRQIERPRLDLP